MLLAAILTMGLLALVFAIGLAFASKKFHVEHDEKIDKVRDVLPSYNCGACGYGTCDNYAKEVTTNKNLACDLCSPGGKKVACTVAEILGREISEKKVQMVAQLKCNGGKDETTLKFEYDGVKNCKGANLISGGPKLCPYGCIGYGDCVNVCKFDALHIGPKGIPVVDKEKCVACGACVKECPKKLFRFVPKEKKVHVLCSSKDMVRDVISACKVGCISCKACERACPVDAIHVKDNLAEIDYSKCIMCGKCVVACPRHIIVDERKK